jgi:hypothetical protein
LIRDVCDEIDRETGEPILAKPVSCDEVSLGKRPRYLNPFEGRKKRIDLSGLFLFDPDVALRINGGSMRSMFVEMGRESLLKGLERVRRTGRCTQRLRDELLELMPMPIQGDFRAALNGEQNAISRLGTMGPWEAFSLGLCEEPGKLSARSAQMQFLYSIEKASRCVTDLCMEGQFIEASILLAKDKLMANFISPEHFPQIANAKKIEDLLQLRVVVAIEVWLSLLAILDIQSRPTEANDIGSHLAKLIPKQDDAEKNTVALLFDLLLSTSQVRSIGALLSDARLCSVKIDMGTFGAWSRGENFPRSSYIKVISKALLRKDNAQVYMAIYSFARHLNFLGYLVQELERLDESSGSDIETRSARSACIPFGYGTFESWLRGRYPFWLEYHRACRNGPS